MADKGDKRPVYVFYGDLNEETVLFQDEFESLKSRLNMTLVQVLEKPRNLGGL